MKTRVCTFCCLVGILNSTMLISGPVGDLPSPPLGSTSHPKLQMQGHYRPLAFVANRGQMEESVRFLLSSGGRSLLFKEDHVLFQLSESREPNGETRLGRLEFPAAAPALQGVEELPAKAHFYRGRSGPGWVQEVPLLQTLAYRDLYAGIDLFYRVDTGRLKSEFRVAPGADPTSIRMRFSGFDSLRLAADGSLVLGLGYGEIVEEAPILFQDIGGERRSVSGQFVQLENGDLGFQVGDYDPAHLLVIDPILVFSSFWGGGGSDRGRGVAVNSQGTVCLGGETSSEDFPVASAYQSDLNGFREDAFVSCFDAKARLIYSTYIGGTGFDQAFRMVMDAEGNAYVTGQTTSSDFPTTAGAFQETFGGAVDSFVAKLDATGTLLYSTYLGGSLNDSTFAIEVDSAGSVYVTGDTNSPDLPLRNPFQAALGGGFDALLIKLTPLGDDLVLATYFGGGHDEFGRGLALDDDQNIYVAGGTRSDDFPTVTPIQSTLNGIGDSFISKFSAQASELSFSTYLGGSGDELARDLDIDRSGYVYVTGDTNSTQDYPIQNAFQPEYGGGFLDGFVSKLNVAGAELLYSSYFGGSGTDRGRSISVSPGGEAHITGGTDSADLPNIRSLQRELGGVSDAYALKIEAGGDSIAYSTFLGGEEADIGRFISVDSNGTAYLVGGTSSSDFPIRNAFQETFSGGGLDGFFVAIREVQSLFFAQYGNGRDPAGDFINSQITAVNLDRMNPAHVTLEVNDPQGQPLAVVLNGQMVQGRTDFVIPPGGSVVLRSDGEGPLSAGSATLESDEMLTGVILFRSNLGIAGVGSSLPLSSFVGPVQSGGEVQSGVAVMSLGQAHTVLFELFDSAGASVAQAGVPLVARGQLARFIEDLSWEPPVDFSNFEGSIRASSPVPFAATLILVTPEGFATLPVSRP